MIFTCPPHDTEAVKERCRELVNQSASFIVICFKDVNDQVHHWEVKDGVDATSG